jgi:STE24 endopeptidase
MRRFFVACCAAVIIALCGGVTASAAVQTLARSQFDRRVDALSAKALLTASPAKLVDPVRQHTAHILDDVQHVGFFVWAAAQIFAFAWLWRSGNAARLRDALRRRFRSRVLVRLGFGAALGLLAPLAGLPFAFAVYRVGFNVGLTEQIIGSWLAHYAASMLIDAVITAVVAAVVLELVDRSRQWYCYFMVFLYASIMAVVAIDPVVFSPIGAHLAASPITAAAPVEIADSSHGSRAFAARTTGAGDFTRIILGDVLVNAATPDELRYVIAHENAHVAHADVMKLTAFAITLFVLAAAIAVLLSDRAGFRRDDDSVSRLALVGAMLGVVVVAMLPVYNAYARGIEYRADDDARRAITDRAAAVRFLVRRADDDMVSLCFRRTIGWYFADHPALASRMAQMRGTADPCPRYTR